MYYSYGSYKLWVPGLNLELLPVTSQPPNQTLSARKENQRHLTLEVRLSLEV